MIAEVSGSPHQKPSPSKTATNTGARTVPNPSRALSTRIERAGRSGWNAAVSVFNAGTVRPKPTPRPRRRQEKERVGRRLVVREELAQEEQGHREQAGGEPDEIDPLRAEAAAQACTEQGSSDRGDDLRQEQRPVLRARQVVFGRVREDRARGRDGDERRCPGRPRRRTRRRLGRGCHPSGPSPWSRLRALLQPLEQMVADAERVGHRGERRVHRADRGKTLVSTT